MHHGVDRQGDTLFGDPVGNFHLLLKAAFVTADPIRRSAINALNGQLNVVEAAFGKISELRCGQPNAGGDEVGVKICLTRAGQQLGQVASGSRFTAREVHMQNAHRGGLLKHADPGFGIQFLRLADHLKRVGAIRTFQRAAMGEFRQHRHGNRGAGQSLAHILDCVFWGGVHAISTILRLTMSVRNLAASVSIRSAGASNLAARWATTPAKSRLPSSARRICAPT